MQHEGEAQPCGDPFHKTVTPQNTPERIAQAQPFVAAADEPGETP